MIWSGLTNGICNVDKIIAHVEGPIIFIADDQSTSDTTNFRFWQSLGRQVVLEPVSPKAPESSERGQRRTRLAAQAREDSPRKAAEEGAARKRVDDTGLFSYIPGSPES